MENDLNKIKDEKKRKKRPLKVISIAMKEDRKYTSMVDEWKRSMVVYKIKKFRKVTNEKLFDAVVEAVKKTFKINKDIEKGMEFTFKFRDQKSKYLIEEYSPEDLYLLISWKNQNDKYWLEYYVNHKKAKLKVRQILYRETTFFGMTDTAATFIYKMQFRKNIKTFLNSIKYLLYEKHRELQKRIEILQKEKIKYGINEGITKIEIYKLKRDFPIQKIIGYIEMANVKIDLSKKVLIPRYETEELISIVNKKIKEENIKNVLDLCTGSGFIAFGIKKQNQKISVVASDISKNSKKQFEINKKINNLNIEFIKSDLFKNIKNKKFDLIVSNPPYISKEEYLTLDKSVKKYDPKIALTDDEDGLKFYKKIIEDSSLFLNKGGFLFFEINPLNVEFFNKKNFTIIKDINSKERFAYKKIN